MENIQGKFQKNSSGIFFSEESPRSGDVIRVNMFHLNMFVIALFTPDVGFKHVKCMVDLCCFMIFGKKFLHSSCKMELVISVTVAHSFFGIVTIGLV